MFPEDNIYPILQGYSKGKAISESVIETVKSYVFEGPDEFEVLRSLANWFKDIGIDNPEAAALKCRSWRLVHCVVPGTYYHTDYQGHPLRDEDWKRLAVPIKSEDKRKKDPFDPLQFLSEPTFSTNEFLRSING